MNRHFTEEDTQMAGKHMKRCSTPFAIRKMQIKTSMRYHYLPIRMTKIKYMTVESPCIILHFSDV